MSIFGRWWNRREVDQLVREAIGPAVEAAVREAVAKQSPSTTVALGQVVEGLFAKQLDGAAKMTGVMGEFVESVGRLALQRSAVLLGSRGGQKRAENMRRRQAEAPAGQPGCEVCVNPNSKNSAAIIRHVNEGHAARRDAQGQQAADALRAHQEYVRSHGGMN